MENGSSSEELQQINKGTDESNLVKLERVRNLTLASLHLSIKNKKEERKSRQRGNGNGASNSVKLQQISKGVKSGFVK